MTKSQQREAAEGKPSGVALLAGLFFTSGALALVYEVIWQRQFALVLGSAAPATVAVLAAYFAGLGLGSVTLGRWASRWRRPLVAYAILEAAIGVGALMVTPLIEILENVYLGLLDGGTSGGGGLMAVRLAVAFAAILVPTFCMGGTLPVLGEWVDRGQKHLGVTAGALYVANTTGAALGAIAVPFWLMPTLGLQGTVWAAAAANGGLALVAWRLGARARNVDTSEAVKLPKQTAATDRRNVGGRVARGVWWLAGISGAATFALQVLWNRAFAQVHENSMHSFAVIVALVILALAVGAQVARTALKRGVAPSRLIAVAWTTAGLGIAVGPWLFFRWTGGLAYLSGGDGWGGQMWSLLWLGGGICFLPMALLGVGLPALMEQAGRETADSSGRVLGRLFAVNVIGSVTGALAAGFLLPAWLGVWGALIWIGALVAAIAVGWDRRGAMRWAVAGVVIAGAWGLQRVEPPRVRVASERGERLVSLAEGAHGVVSVVEREGSRRLKLNNHYALGGTAATGDERMQAHLPLLLHPEPRSVAFLGLGTGVTAGGAMFHALERVVAVEIVPEAIVAAREHFAPANAGLMEEVRVRVIADDARHFLRATKERFDVIVGDLVVPWRAGEGALLTLEQFEAARAALADGGVFCQWLPLFQLSEMETEILLRTFLSVFPEARVWRGDFSPTEPAIALVGKKGGGAVEALPESERVAEMTPDPANPHLAAPGALWMHYVGTVKREDLPRGDARVNSENRPWVELLGPRLHGGRNDAVFVGYELEAWLQTLRAKTLARESALREEQRRAMEAGAALAEMILKMRDGDRNGAGDANGRLRGLLPADTYRALLGGE